MSTLLTVEELEAKLDEQDDWSTKGIIKAVTKASNEAWVEEIEKKSYVADVNSLEERIMRESDWQSLKKKMDGGSK